jgi:hypothetical protein
MLLAALVLAACRGDDGAPTSRGGEAMAVWMVSAEPLLDIGVEDGEEPYLLHEVTSATRLDDGRVVVANDGSKELRFFDDEGTFLFAAGRSGEGPGEYLILDRVRAEHPDTLLVFDTYQQRISLVSASDGSYLGAHPLPEQQAFPFDEWVHGRTILDSPLDPSARGVVASALDALRPFEGAQHRYARVTEEGHLWVTDAKAPSPGMPTEWRIHDLEGRPIATLRTPPDLHVLDEGPDWLLGRWRDALDIEHVRLYALSDASGGPVGDPARLAAVAEAFEGAPPASTRVAHEDAGISVETLRTMAMSEEIFFSEHYHYTASIDSLREANPRFQLPDGVDVTPLWVEDRGWMVLASERGTANTCFISYGFVRIIGRLPGEIACWAATP